MAFATTTDLAKFLFVDESDLPADSERLLQRASELMIYVVSLPEARWSDAQMDAVTQAVCAQVEFWQSEGEGVEMGRLVLSRTQSKMSETYSDASGGSGGSAGFAPLASRARYFLMPVGLLYSGVQ